MQRVVGEDLFPDIRPPAIDQLQLIGAGSHNDVCKGEFQPDFFSADTKTSRAEVKHSPTGPLTSSHSSSPKVSTRQRSAV
jgi:hypothetical protein